MTSPATVVVVGDALVDVVVRPLETVQPGSDTASTIRWRSGGAAANVARAIADQGGRARLVARVGDDVAATFLTDALQRHGVEAHVVRDPDRSTGTVVALVGAGDRDMLNARQAHRTAIADAVAGHREPRAEGAFIGAQARDIGDGRHLGPGDLRSGWLDAAAHVHVSGYALLSATTRPAGLHAMQRAREAGTPVSVDPASAAPLRRIGAEAFLTMLPPHVLLTPNADEARVLAGREDVEEAAMCLGARTGEVLVSRGAGGVVWSDGRTVLRRSAVAVTGTVDPVGAGDALVAGLLTARVAGHPLEVQLDEALVAAGRAVGRPGPWTG